MSELKSNEIKITEIVSVQQSNSCEYNWKIIKTGLEVLYINMNGFTVPNLSIFTFKRNITIKRQNIKISNSPTSYTGLLRLSEKKT